ncbi:erythrocyte membrane protein 1, PfEMP1, putative [Plasmodium sp. gorilla clade G1]|nr:erythrocyte membrane protein 1, PfEMP1, putative [Plasmodium sp. gorilla clade G1]
MAPKAPPATSSSITYSTVKDLLEDIGRSIQQQAKSAAEKRSRNSLLGNISQAEFNDKNIKVTNLCQLDHTKHTNVANVPEDQDPCYGRVEKLFSDVLSGQCTYNRIRDSENNDNTIGACAPYRRLHICDYNLENIDAEKIKSTHNLLADVLLVAKHEGQRLVKKYEKHKNTNRDSKICTALARSFADIGDIMRGKDLYLGNKKKNENQREKEKLEIKLKSFFKNIYEHLKGDEKKKYEDDGNYFKLREDWWALNREEIWNAITCNAPKDAEYFEYKSGPLMKFSNSECGHNQGSVPTNLDYVPQFLRWFDEWGEEFCRIRNHKLKEVKEACRDEENGKYCSHNGYDCTKIIGNEEFFSKDSKCTGCLVKCNPYEIWLPNQRKEFQKQTKKYKKEILTYTSNQKISDSNINNEYYEEFYKKLGKKDYKTVNNFITLLNEGRYCKEGLPVEEVIDFTKTDEKDTFYRSEYCQVCPYCGVECKDKKCTKNEIHNNCRNNKFYILPKDVTATDINVVFSGENQGDITKKLSSFCNNSTNEKGESNETWECYYMNEKDNNCKMKRSTLKDQKHREVMSFYGFFDLWVRNLLIDTINWKNELNDCINNTNGMDCNEKCNKNCICFDKWIKTKEFEWETVKKVYENQEGNSHDYYNKLNGLFQGYFFPVMNKLNKEQEEKEEEEWNKFMEELKNKMDPSRENTDTGNSQDSIKRLLDHLKETATICKDNNTNEACFSNVDRKRNPCAKNTTGDNRKHATVKQIAQYFKRLAHEQLEERGSRGDLKGDASKGTYKHEGSAEKFKEKLCEISVEHSNRDGGQTDGPCHNKDNQNNMFAMEIGWIPHDFTRTTHEDFYMSPRRQHFCTSNVEHLDTDASGLTGGNAIHSLLGDVLLSAKKQADFIKKKYEGEKAPKGFKDHTTKCRAIKYSFADIGDIIKGTDLWDGNVWDENTQNKLVKIFKKIKENLDESTKKKYSSDKEENKYINLRKDWWEANRAKVWEGMKCHIKELNDASVTKQSNDYCGYSDHTPLDDYIPKKLRWLTEWAEWFCKMQSQEYEELEKGCQVCMGNDKSKNCMKGTPECTSCKEASEKYEEKIELWKEQWETVSEEYEKLYNKARIDAFNGGPEYYTTRVQEEDQSVYDFMYELHLQNGGKKGPPSATHPYKSSIASDKHASTVDTTCTVYRTAEGYVHQELPNMGCISQTQFCKTSGNDEDKYYAFKDTPHEYDALRCLNRKVLQLLPQETAEEPEKNAASSSKKKDDVDVCRVVGDHFSKYKKGNGKNGINGCKQKTSPFDWNCSDTQLVTKDGTCMPSRRNKLCVNDLKELSNRSEEKTLREAFIKCAAKEIYFSWEKYKKNNKVADVKLKNGEIPDDFKRIMYYSYGDYRDIFYNTDISTTPSIKDISHTIKTVLNKQTSNKSVVKGKEDNSKLQAWWEENKSYIWEAMICGLTQTLSKVSREKVFKQLKGKYRYHTVSSDLEKFAKKPQFLRWYIEWGDEFCEERKKKEEKVATDCTKDYDGCERGNNIRKCADACKEYKDYINKKNVEYTKQEGKFNTEKTSSKPEYKGYSEKKASEYLQKECLNSSCNYMQKVTHNSDYWKNTHTTYEDEKLQKKCDCPPPCTIVHSILGDKSSTSYREGCREKYKNGIYNVWDCNKSEKGNEWVCIPPRRKRLFVQRLQEFDGQSPLDLRKAFIETAAIETFFSWHEFKKEKEREIEKKKKDQGFVLLEVEEEEQDPEKELEKGIICKEFKRQMFYTFGDYRDIFFGNDIRKDNDNLKKKITDVLSKDGKTISPQDWWKKNGKDIWEGMLCALSYNTEKKIKDEGLRKKLISSNNNYNNVTISCVPNSLDTSDDTKLEQFASRPKFFRWLEEWGEEFCRKRKITIDKIKDECQDKNGKKKCSGDGEDCENMARQDYETVSNFFCPRCAQYCRSYKKWISIKKDEFDKQEQKYKTEISNVQREYGNTYDKEFVGKLSSNYGTIDSFLENIKEGPCSNSKNIGNDKIYFKDKNKTFKHAEYCDPCPLLGVKCKQSECSDDKEKKCHDKKKIDANDIEKLEGPVVEVNMLVIDKRENEFEDNLPDCKDTGIFKGIRKDEWLCRNICGVDICALKILKEDNVKQYIQIRALLKRWLENFLEDYNKIKDKISHCTKNGEGSICINDCTNKCKCVETWLRIKKAEWVIVRDRFFNQYNVHSQKSYQVKSFLEQRPFEAYYKKAQEVVEDETERYKLWGCTGELECKTDEEKKKFGDFITNLINKLQEKIKSCKEKPDKRSDSKCEPPPHGTQTDDSPDPDTLSAHMFSPTFCNVPPNPCAPNGATNIVGVKEMAEEVQQQTHDKMMERSVVVGDSKGTSKAESVLKGDISQGAFRNGRNSKELKTECNIKREHSNANRPSNNPCNGKDNDDKMFDMEERWKSGEEVSQKHKDLFLPPRREHFCTSNLEKINVGNVTKNGNVNDTFLVDVLLAAKEEADFIKRKYDNTKKANAFNDNETMCRAMKYSFSDIGDIIKGTDMWDKDNGENETQNKLVQIFKKIKEQIPEDTMKKKYADDTNDPKHLDFRKDWWEANRDQIWKAMTCEKNGIKCDKDPPFDDYIPQRLRWMTEWAEWYCKIQKEAYDKLRKGCDSCKVKIVGKGNIAICKNEDKCKDCKEKCQKYKEIVEKWEEQWNVISDKYTILYEEAKKDVPTIFKDTKDEYLVQFLKQLQAKNNESNNIYATAEGYVHQEAKYLNCDTQKLFCQNKNDGTGSDNYAFRKYPHKYKDPCECRKKLPPPPPMIPPPFLMWGRRKKNACQIARDILRGNNGKSRVGECHQKETYPEWKCDKRSNLVTEDGICMPPRRQKLCVQYLEKTIKNTEQLKNAFVKSAAAETFLLWQKYKKDKNGNIHEFEKTLKDGTIPEDFKRQMFYTFADYKDLCLNKDISSKTDIHSAVLIAKENIDDVFSMIGQRTFHYRKRWWNNNAKDIWEGMLCALEKAGGGKKKLTDMYKYESVTFGSDDTTTLSNFSERPQFLRWFTEWGEHFCNEQKKEFTILKDKCDSCKVTDSDTKDDTRNKTCDDKEKCAACKEQCKEYKKKIETWKNHYTSQKGKFQLDKSSGKYDNNTGGTEEKISDDARDYLKTQLQNMKCINGNSEKCEYTCMDTSSYTNTEMPESLDDEPKDVKGKCNCVPDECNALSVSGSGFPDGQAFGGGVLAGKCTGLGEPKKKIEPPQYDTTNDILKTTIPVGIALALGSIAFLFIKKQPKSPVDLLRVLDIHKGDYGTPTPKSSNRYIPYVSDTYKGKTYIYMEGDTSGDEDKYIWDLSSSDITSSESEYEEMDINDIYVPGSPKYKTLIEVVLEPSKNGANTLGDGEPLDDMVPTTNTFTDEEWNELKNDFISQYVQRESMVVPQYDVSTELPMNITEGNVFGDKMDEKPFITSIHDRDLYTGEEISYNINMGTNSMDDSKYVSNNVYSGIDLINDTLSDNKHIDIYDEVLKRKENELFGTKHMKNTTNNSVAKNTNNDPIMNQLDLLHKWLDRHRDMCEKWNSKEDILNKLNEQWNKDNGVGGDISTSNGNKTLNTDVSIEIDMDETKGKKEFSNMDTILDDMEDDIYYDVNDDEKPSTDDIPMDHNKVDVPKKVHVKMKILNNTSNGSLEPEFPISDVWNI